MTHFPRICEGAAVEPVLAQLEEHPELWNVHTWRKTLPGGPHSRMSDIWVRYNDASKIDPDNPGAFNAEHVPVWYPSWRVLTSLHPIVHGLNGLVNGEMIGAVLITKVPPGCGIGKHRDDGWHVQYYEKFYVCLASEPGADFVCEHDGVIERLNPKPGDIHLFDNRKEHWVENNSPSDRITLIVCIRTGMFGRPT